MVQTRFALMLYIRMSACHILLKAFLKSLKTCFRFWSMLEALYTEDSEVQDLFLFCGASSGFEPSLFFSSYLFGLGFKPWSLRNACTPGPSFAFIS